MKEPRIHCDFPLSAGEEINLQDERHHYLAHVLRLSVGNPVNLFNGNAEFACHVVAVERHLSRVRCEREVTPLPPSPLRIALYLSLAKSRSMDPAIQKATELGAASVQPILAARSVSAVGSGKRKLAHWQGIARSACEQCGRADLPLVAAPVSFEEITIPESAAAFVLHPGSRHSLIAAARALSVSCVVVLIGPEGGLTESEVQAAQEKGFVPVSIGPRLLRVETAVTTTLSLLQACVGDLADNS